MSNQKRILKYLQFVSKTKIIFSSKEKHKIPKKKVPQSKKGMVKECEWAKRQTQNQLTLTHIISLMKIKTRNLKESVNLAKVKIN